jgi:hypothetical protein
VIRRDTLIQTAQTLLTLASHYRGAAHREMRVDGLVYGVLHTKFGVTRQHHVRRTPRKSKPDRIDFKQAGTNPVVIEFAVRTRAHLNEVYGSQNKSELRKMAKQTKMSARYLLLLDLSGVDPLSRERLKSTYDKINAGRGKFPRTSVRVIYAHPTCTYHFLWRPWAAT